MSLTVNLNDIERAYRGETGATLSPEAVLTGTIAAIAHVRVWLAGVCLQQSGERRQAEIDAANGEHAVKMAGINTEHAPTEDRSRRVVELVRQGIMMTGGNPEEVSQFALDEAFAIVQEKESKIRALNYERDSKIAEIERRFEVGKKYTSKAHKHLHRDPTILEANRQQSADGNLVLRRQAAEKATRALIKGHSTANEQFLTLANLEKLAREKWDHFLFVQQRIQGWRAEMIPPEPEALNPNFQ